MLKSLFGRSRIEADFSFIGADMHSHLLPGLDDGLKTLEESMFFMKELQQLGYRKLICTPHILSDLYRNSPETILPKLDTVRNELAKNNINIQVEAAAEYMIDHEFEKLVSSGEKLLSFGNNYVLIEMSYLAPSPNFDRVIFDLQMKGYKPIFAHPERYNYYHKEFSAYDKMIDLGCVLQVNLLSLSGFYGKEVKKAGEKLIQKQMVSFLGTDMHHDRHLHMLKDISTNKQFISMISSIDLLNKTL